MTQPLSDLEPTSDVDFDDEPPPLSESAGAREDDPTVEIETMPYQDGLPDVPGAEAVARRGRREVP